MRTYGLITHAAIDYAIFVLLILMPWIGGYAVWMWASLYTIGLALGLLFLNLFTDYPGGAIKRLSFTHHQWIEWASALLFILAPFYLFPATPMMKWLVSLAGIAVVTNTFFTRPPPVLKAKAIPQTAQPLESQRPAPPPEQITPPGA